MKTFSFQKEERLSSRKRINRLFSEAHTFRTGPFLVFWLTEKNATGRYPAEIAIGVPKKRVRKAVDRNQIKRRIREAIRLNKHLLYDSLSNQKVFMSIFVLYQEEKIASFFHTEKQVILLLKKLIRMYEEGTH